MGTFTCLTYHIVFGTKYRRKTIRPHFQEQLYEYIGGVIRKRGGHLIQIGGIEDHVHILANLPAKFAVSDVVRDIKSNASTWIHEMENASESEKRFEWQIGYGAFTVSYSQIPRIQAYIVNQKTHHLHRTFEQEFIGLLQRHNIQFERKYLFEGEFHG
jgi:putative transposase